MKTIIWTVLAGCLVSALNMRADVTLARDGKPQCVILRQPGISAPEEYALGELTNTLHEITGATFSVEVASNTAPAHAIVFGPGPLARKLFPGVPFDQLGEEEIVIKTKDGRLLLAGGRPRGTLYAVAQFLQKQCGVRWWTPWASRIPKQPTLRIGRLNVRYESPFESRDPFWYPAFNAAWAVRNFSNSEHAHLTPAMGGAIVYRGFVHTFYPLVPPAENFAKHPDWYSLINGKRTAKHAQLCLTNPELRRYVVKRVKQWLRESPDAQIVSVSQNDCFGACQCPKCSAIDKAQGSHAGSLLDFVNYVAAQIQPEFPHVAIDTLAYQYTRKPPKTIRPRSNVIIRLCSIECNFRQPLNSPSNASFAHDIHGWAKICHRLYVWNYTTDFAHYVQPHPNWFVLGPNLRFFARNHVRGVFEQGAYQSYGSEFAEMRAWVLAQLLWNPFQNDRALIHEFLAGYYGPAAPAISRYLNLMTKASAGYKLTCFAPTDTPFNNFKTLSRAEELWDEAEKAVADDPEYLPRVRLAHLPVRYVWLVLWDKLRHECAAAGGTWPLPDSRQAVAKAWLHVAEGQPGLPWTRITQIRESGTTPQHFIDSILHASK